MAVLLSAGDQAPVMPLFDVVGNADNELPEQIGATCIKPGVIDGFTVIVIVAVEAHCPVSGVKV